MAIMKRIRLYFAILFAMLSSIAFAYEDPGYYFKNYNVEATVHENNAISITENIDVYFTLESHGIYRIIPTWTWIQRDISEKQDGSATKTMHYKSPISNIETSEEWTDVSEDGEDLLVMRFGVYDKTFIGPHSYTIKYDLTYYDDRISQGDAFFHSLLGDGWDCPTEHFTFKVHFNKPLSDEELERMQLFTSKLGGKENTKDKYVTTATNSVIEGELFNVEPRSAVTMFIPLNEGYFSDTSSGSADSFFDSNNPKTETDVCWGLLIGISLYLFFLILKLLNSKKDIVTKVISFYPPKDCSSAEVGTLIDCSVDDCDMISLIPWFAQQGYISIDNTGKSPILHKIKDLPDNAPKYQKTLFNGFFQGDRTEFDTGNVSTSFAKSWLKAKESATKTYSDKLNKVSWGKLLLLFIAIFATSVFNYWTINSSDGWALALPTIVSFVLFTLFQLGIGNDATGKALKVFLVICDAVVLGIFYIVLSSFLSRDDATHIPAEAIYAVNFGLVIVCFFAKQMTYMSQYRRERIGEILGLHEFISTAEKQQLEHLQAEDEKYFYNILPYAVAFGMAKNWAKKFEGINVTPVEWYQGDNNVPMTYALSNMATKQLMNESLQKAIQQELIARQEAIQRSSGGSSHSSATTFGGGGGGFAGGGFGGGGGGRW